MDEEFASPEPSLGIGEFARLSNLSPGTLRYYDEIQLLVPHHTNQETKYRRYHPRQLLTAYLLYHPKRCGLSLGAVEACMLAQHASVWRAQYQQRIAEIEREVQRLQVVQAGLRRLLLQPLPVCPPGVRVFERSPRPMVFIEFETALEEVEARREAAFGRLREHLNVMGVGAASAPTCFYPPREHYRCRPFTGAVYRALAAIEVPQPVLGKGDIQSGYTPGGWTVAALHRGLYEHITFTKYHLVLELLQRGDPVRPETYWNVEVFERGPWDGGEPTEYRTDIQWILPTSTR